jgi:hypothetical protein
MPATAVAQGDDARYALAGGCSALRPASLGQFVAKGPGGGYGVTAMRVADAEPFRMQATTLGRYLLYGRQGDYLAATDNGGVAVAADAGPAADWGLEDVAGGGFTLSSASGKVLAVTPDGKLASGSGPAAGGASTFTFEPATGCADFPEAAINAVGEPSKGATPYGDVSGFIDAHMHMMGFEFLGGDVHCGRPWDRYGVTHALAGCPRTEVGSPAIESFLSGDLTTPGKDPVGWPTFKDWPRWNALTHEQSYYRWLERAWRGGLRIFVNLFVENHALCSLYPHRHNSCNEMTSVRLQHKDLLELERYIDAQNGGPGKGWFRIVSDPYQARRVINDGKLAVVPGIEVSNLLDCGVYNDVPQCDAKQVDERLNEVYNQLGVRDMELINKFDNGFGGVAGDGALTGVLVNAGNRLETGKFWQMQPCQGPAEQSDHQQFTVPVVDGHSVLGDAVQALLPGGFLPIYQHGPMCNARGLTSLGEHLVRQMMAKRMIIDPDHLDVISRKQLLSIVESERYSGIVSSHSWSTQDAYPRIYKLGGFVTPYAGSSTNFAKEWKKLRTERDPRYAWGFGWGADMNGFGAQGSPRQGNAKNPVKYPFKSFDGAVTFDRNRTGKRVWDINVDGVAHYGLYPDWIEDLRMIAGDEIVKDMSHGAEAYLQMWERAVGVAPSDACRSARLRFTGAGLGLLRLGTPAEEVLRGVGQPASRVARTWRYCVQGTRPGRGQITAAFTPQGTVGLIASTAPRHRALGMGRGSRSTAAGVVVRDAGHGSRFVYGAASGRVRFVAVTSAAVAADPARLREYLHLAGVS